MEKRWGGGVHLSSTLRYPDTWATPIWPTDTWPTDIWSTDTWPTDIWPISAWGDIWPTDKMSHFNNSFIQFNNRISSIQRAVSDGNITKMWKESKEKFGQNCLLAKCPPPHALIGQMSVGQVSVGQMGVGQMSQIPTLLYKQKQGGGDRRRSNFGPNAKHPTWWDKKGGRTPCIPQPFTSWPLCNQIG